MSPDRAPLLSVEGLVKRFGGFRALDVLSFAVGAGEILGLVGPNGSGKTTCINVISGLYRPDGGAIRFDGRSIGGLPSHRLVHAGINRTFQVPRPFLTLTVRETWVPGWKALIDGQAAKIQRKSPVFFNIEIPAGQHELILKYDPLEVRLGISLSFCSLVLVILVLTGIRLFWIPGITTAKGLDGPEPAG